MENYSKIKELHIGKKKGFRVLLAVELLMLLLGLAGLFGEKKVYEYRVEDAVQLFGAYSEERGIVAGGQNAQEGSMVDFTGISLSPGTYRVQLRYFTDTNALNLCEVSDDTLTQRALRVNPGQLFEGLTQTNFDMWLLRSTSDMTVHAYYSGAGTLGVQGLTIRETGAWNRIVLFCMICALTLINAAYCYVCYDRQYRIPIKNKTVTFGLGIVLLFAGMPLTLDYLIGGGDLIYHLMRVEGIRDSILTGRFPVRISPEWQQGYGYASPIFYGETLLYPAALFRLIGFSVTTSYRLYMLCILVGTVLIAYHCFKGIFKEAYVGLFCSALYSMSVYRIYKSYSCGSWGEMLGIMLLPLLVYGFWRVFGQDIHEESYQRSWIPLTAGFTLLLQSHLLTGEMAGLFTILLCLIFWKRVIRPKTFMVLAKTVICSVLLSAWFLIPFVDYMLTGDFVIQHVSARTIQYRGLYPAHLLFTFFVNGESVFFDESGMYDSPATGVGIVLLMALLAFAYLCFAGKKEGLTKEEKRLGRVCSAFSVLALLMSLSIFPWDRIQALGDFAATLVSSIQFPNRFLTIANVGLTAVAGVVAKYVLARKERWIQGCWFGGMLLLLVAGSVYLTEDVMEKAQPVKVYNAGGMGTGAISGGEYLPYGADPQRFLYHDPVCSGELQAAEYEKEPLGATVRLTNPGTEAEKAAFALLYYKGYHAYDAVTGEKLQCYAGENFEVTVDIPAGFDGTVRVTFASPWYWRLGEAVSVAALAGMLLTGCCQKRKRTGKSEEAA